MKSIIRSVLAFGILGVSGLALAQDQLPAFEEVDQNQDGQISRDEAAQIEGLDFTTADTNQDGNLDRTEYMAAMGQGGQGQEPGQSGDPTQPGQTY